ncbi:MAG: TonB-dependent receptor [Cyclobacteriaceae bacterium]
MKEFLLKNPRQGRVVFLSFLVNFCLLIGAYAASEGEKSIEDVYLSLEVSSGIIEDVFIEVGTKTGFNFHYSEKTVSKQKLTVNMKDVSLANCLRHISKETGLSFKRINETIHVDKSENTEYDVTEEFTSKQEIRVSGRVTGGGEGLPGVTVIVKGTQIGTVSDIDGNYTINVPSTESILVYSFVGFASKEVRVGNQSEINVSLEDDVTALEEVVVIGYGEQKKETVVGAVTQASSQVLERTAGIPNVATALTGNLPGLITSASTGTPGDENPRIVIRGNNTWNGNNSPLILVDGVERSEFFNTMDVASVQSISVLKDASATAVFGSRGANGVIIVTTKRGREGKAEITANVNTSVKTVSKLPGTKDAYEAMRLRNRAIEYELATNPASWNDIIPQEIIDKYRNPANLEEAERYPNIDWQDALFKDYAMAYNANIGVRGGTEVTKYFANLDFQNEQDLMRNYDNGRGYDPGFSYNRLNFRSNLDFQLTNSTKLQTNLGGSYGVRKSPWNFGQGDYGYWIAAYGNSPDAFIPRYSDGVWGFHAPNRQSALNSVRNLATSGLEYRTTATISTNFVLDQNLDMLIKGLNFKGTLALDNTFIESQRGVNDLYNAIQEKWIDPATGVPFYEQAFDPSTRFDFYDQGAAWSPSGGEINAFDRNAQFRKSFYQLQLNYQTSIVERHNISLMGLMNRLQQAGGSEVPSYREDWVFRTTYNFDGKYLLEYNGAYNGSEKFGPDYRFAFFSSGGVGWLISEENFMKSIGFLDYLKVRASYGGTGDDGSGSIPRFAFVDDWEYGEAAKLGVQGWRSEESPYTWYKQGNLGNPSVQWESVYKSNLAIDFTFWNGLIDGSVDFFRDKREDIYLSGNGRAVPSYFGASAPAANLGKVTTEGFEIELGVNHTFSSGIRLWADFAMTHAKDEILLRDDAQLLDDYQKQQGFQIGQSRTHVSSGYYNTWDEAYASTVHNTNEAAKLPGNYHIIDFNADGIIDNLDVIPYGFSSTPQNTFNTNIGFEWKGVSAFVQFYGVNNVTRQVVFNSLAGQLNRAYEEGSYWSKDNTNADTPMPRWLSIVNGANSGSRYFYDGSFLRLKNAEIAYRFESGWINKIGLQSMRVYLNGNNLLLWTKMPDDRESNFAGTGWASQGAYPTVRRFNLGLNLTF